MISVPWLIISTATCSLAVLRLICKNTKTLACRISILLPCGIFTEGGGNHSIDFKSFPVKPYQIYFMVPGQVHRWNFEGPVDGYIINFSAEFFQSFLLRPDYLESLPFFTGNVDDEVIN
jgi:hypothetical protein